MIIIIYIPIIIPTATNVIMPNTNFFLCIKHPSSLTITHPNVCKVNCMQYQLYAMLIVCNANSILSNLVNLGYPFICCFP